jgi:two-component system OmpR family response regulator
MHVTASLLISPKKILLVEDEEKIADFLLRSLTKAGFHVDHEIDGHTGLRRVNQTPYDLLLLDLMLPKLNGLDMLTQMRQNGNAIPVIILSAKGDLNDRLKGFENGADDYLPKPFFVEELVAKMKVILARQQVAPTPQALSASHLTLDLISRKARWLDTEVVLSQREFSLLHYLMQTPGHIFSRQQILKNVWNIHFDPETNVVDVCIQRIKRKLNSSENTPAWPIESVRGVGYRVKTDEHP